MENEKEENPPNYNVVGTVNLPPNMVMKRYTFRKGVHIILSDDGALYLQGHGYIYTKDKIVTIPHDDMLLFADNVALFEGYSYYIYNESPKVSSKIFGSDGSLILSPGKDVCTLL